MYVYPHVTLLNSSPFPHLKGSSPHPIMHALHHHVTLVESWNIVDLYYMQNTPKKNAYQTRNSNFSKSIENCIAIYRKVAK